MTAEVGVHKVDVYNKKQNSWSSYFTPEYIKGLNPYSNNIPISSQEISPEILNIMSQVNHLANGKVKLQDATIVECSRYGVDIQYSDWEDRLTTRLYVAWDTIPKNENLLRSRFNAFYLYPNGIGINTKLLDIFKNGIRREQTQLSQRYVSRGDLQLLNRLATSILE